MLRPTKSILAVLVLAVSVLADFRYDDFNQTLGLVFNGNATTTDCGESTSIELSLESEHSTNSTILFVEQSEATVATTECSETTNDCGEATTIDSLVVDSTNTDKSAAESAISNNSTILFVERSEVGGIQSRYTIETNTDDEYSASIARRVAQFGHRDNFVASIDTGCSTRLRLTNSHQSQVGSVWYEKRLPVLTGFETTFSFQVSDHSRSCSDHVDPSLSHNRRYRSCAVHGGDGFAFVLHADGRDTAAIGHDGEDLGYGGMNNSLAVEFDLWTNFASQQDSDDVFEDHISVHSGSFGRNNPGQQTALGYGSPAANLADGKKHYVRISYLPYIEQTYFHLMTASENLLPYLKDNGEGRRLGTLAVFLDDGIDANRPILAIPLNLSILLNLPQGLAYVGFTGSTGLKWGKHDILSWTWCDEDCL